MSLLYIHRQGINPNLTLRENEMKHYVTIQDLDLSNATILGFNGCAVYLRDGYLLCKNVFGNVVAKFPIDSDSCYKIYRGLPDDIGIIEDGFEVFEMDFDDEDCFEEDQPIEILEQYSYIKTINFTIIMRNLF